MRIWNLAETRGPPFSDNHDKERYYEISLVPHGKSECECEEPAYSVFTLLC